MREVRLQGIGASPGIVIGEVRMHARKRLMVRPKPLKEHEVEAELARFEKAADKARKAIQRVARQVKRRLGAESANIFEAHLMILEDPMLADRTREIIKDDRLNADFALLTAMSEIQKAFSGVKDEFFRQRLADLEDVGRRLIGRPASTPAACWRWPPRRAAPPATRRSSAARRACRRWSASRTCSTGSRTATA